MSRIFFLKATIFRLHIDDRIICDAEGDTDLNVKIDLLDIPSLVIHRNESSRELEQCDGNCGINLHYYTGRACHFVAKWPDIVDSIKRKPLRIGIFRLYESFPLCTVVVPFSKCACHLVEKAMKELSPFELRDNFNIIDSGGNPAGHISLEIMLHDRGKHVTALFALDRESFVLKNDSEAGEYRCGGKKHFSNADKGVYKNEAFNDCCWIDDSRENFASAITGICLAASRLSRGKPEVKKVHRSLAKGDAQNNALKEKHVATRKLAKKSKKKKKK